MTSATATADPLVQAEGTARMPDATTLRTLHWAAVGEPWAVALIVHGLGEHAGRYETVAAALTEAGIDVYGYDHRGFGGSSGFRAYVDHWSQLHDDLANRVVAARAERPGLPLVMYAHSLGGLIATGYVVPGTGRPLPDLLVLSAPGIEAVQPTWKKKLAALLTGVVPRMRLANGLARDGLSHDPSVQAKVDADPLCISTSTVRFGAEAFAEQDRLRALLPGLASMPVPTYLLLGSDDPIVPPRSSEVLAAKGSVTRRVWPGLRHECHHEPEQAEVLAAVVAWIRSQAANLAAGG
ncbi:MAG: alpha/beta hydrolase [Candidatus Limnocylindrales bacterium]